MRSMAAKTLRHAGFDVQDVDSGEDALAQFEQHSHDLILLDVMMPGIDGYEVCQRVRAMAHGARRAGAWYSHGSPGHIAS